MDVRVTNDLDDTWGVFANDARATTRTDVEVVAKARSGEIASDAELAAALKTTLKLGNVVSLRGALRREGHDDDEEQLWSVNLVVAERVIECWATAHPGKCFNRAEYAQVGANVKPNVSAPCKFFINNGTCAKGDACRYAHDRSARKDWILKRKANRRSIAATTYGDPHGESVANKSARAQKFAEFLSSTFGDETLRRGSGVLDVAGGRGDVSFELHTKRGIKTTLVEPRERKLNKSQHKYLKEIDATESPNLCEHIRREFTRENWHLFKECSIVVGMHPDEATEAIVDFALAYQKPFAIVPCCVFPELFPHRRDGNGNIITDRRRLVDYLVEKTKGEMTHLEIAGANQVVYSRGTHVDILH